MTSTRRAWLAGAAGLVWTGCDRALSAASGEPGVEAESAARDVVLVELFTSQGCSSCPRADTLMATLAEEDFGVTVARLAFHVDYWNELGWPDPFSDPAWTGRQRAYAAAARSRRVYTPQLVFDGRDRGVGVSASRVREAIVEAAAQPPAADLQVSARRANGQLFVRVSGQGHGERTATIGVAVTDSGHETRVTRGENAGRRLRNDAVVRQLVRAPADGTSHELVLAEPPHAGSGRVVAFVQDPVSARILRAAVALG